MSTGNRRFQANHSDKIGVLIVNTGTPADPTPKAVHQFLAQFLADPNVIDYPRWLWLPILHGIILRVRPKRSARLYQRIWTESGSPLLLGTQKLAEKIETVLTVNLDTSIRVLVGMRYGEPSIPTTIQTLKMFGVRRIVVLPLFPQYSGTTTGSILSVLEDQMGAWPDAPQLTIIHDYHNHPAYIGAIGDQIRNHTNDKSHLLLSFHGVPRSYVNKGDPYESQCLKSAKLISQNLGLKREEWSLAFQSRFGPQEWLTPYTDEELTRLGKKNLTKLQVICPGFAVDCLETLDEIANEGAEIFRKAGGGIYEYIPALNDQANHVKALSEILISHIK